MVLLPFLKDKHILILGAARSGKAVLASAIASGARVSFSDRSPVFTEKVAALFPDAKPVDLRTVDWKAFDYFAPSPIFPHVGSKRHAMIRKADQMGVPLTSEVDLFFRTKPAGRLLGVSGTNGKSSTVAMTHFVLEAMGQSSQRGGNIGEALLTLNPPTEDDITVIELSSSQLEFCDHLVLDVAIMMPLYHDHAERYDSFQDYVDTKRRLFEGLKPGGIALYCADDPHQQAWLTHPGLAHVRFVPYSLTRVLETGFSLVDNQVTEACGEQQNILSDIVRRGTSASHTLPQACEWLATLNVVTVFAVLRLWGYEADTVLAHMAAWPGLPHRRQRFSVTLPGFDAPTVFIDDSVATNMQAAAYGLKTAASLGQKIFWICGGVSKEGDGFSPVKPYLKHVAHAFTYGDACARLQAFLRGQKVASTMNVLLEQTLQAAWEALRQCKKEGKPSPVVLLSPAGSSFDQFLDYSHRGRVFQSFFQQLKDAQTKCS